MVAVLEFSDFCGMETFRPIEAAEAAVCVLQLHQSSLIDSQERQCHRNTKTILLLDPFFLERSMEMREMLREVVEGAKVLMYCTNVGQF